MRKITLTTIAALSLLSLGGCYSSETWAELDARCPNDQVVGGASTGWGGGTIGCVGDPGYPGNADTDAASPTSATMGNSLSNGVMNGVR